MAKVRPQLVRFRARAARSVLAIGASVALAGAEAVASVARWLWRPTLLHKASEVVARAEWDHVSKRAEAEVRKEVVEPATV